MTLLVDLAVRSSVPLALGLLLSAGLSKRSAALRHRVLSTSLLAAALVMPVSVVLPGWNVTLPAGMFGSRPAATPTEPGRTPTVPGSIGQPPATPSSIPQHFELCPRSCSSGLPGS